MHGLIPDINLVILQVALEHIAKGFDADTNWDFQHGESTKMQAAFWWLQCNKFTFLILQRFLWWVDKGKMVQAASRFDTTKTWVFFDGSNQQKPRRIPQIEI